MAKLQKKKSDLQEKIVKALYDNKGHGIIAGATGIGKAKAVIDFIVSQNMPLKILWVVPTRGLRGIMVPNEWKKWGQEQYFIDHVKTICYRSLFKEDTHYDIIVLDEGHHITRKAYGQSETMRYKKYGTAIFMTATVPTEDIKVKIINHMGLEVIYQVDVDNAVKLGVVAPFDIRVYPIVMSKKNDFHVNTQGKSYITSEHNRYYNLQHHIDGFRKGKAPMQLYLARMHSIYRFQSKVRAAQSILERVDASGTPKRVLIFCGSIKAAESICPFTYHSKTDLTDYTRFNNKEIDRLAVVNALNEGHNMVDVDIAIMVQVNSKDRNYIQRQGRAIRWRKGHRALIIVLYAHNTVDYHWVRKSLKSIDPSKIKIGKEVNI